ncbi:MAG: L,D-transpeptidase [Verrucomicrobia bacterium]|nr:L,D-transpeptidase [Verrucomicrobiota bacterium]
MVVIGVSVECPALAADKEVIINLTQQAAYLLQNRQVVLESPISSGRDGWRTPTGHFHVLAKDASHESGSFGSIRDGGGRAVNSSATPASYVPPGCRYVPAPMPYFIEFAPKVGMHAGYLPGVPASHGCVRMPRDLAAQFFAAVPVGTPVYVTGDSRQVSRLRRAMPLYANQRYTYRSRGYAATIGTGWR